MVLNRGFAVAKLLKNANLVSKALVKQPVRLHGDWVYRTGSVPPEINVKMATAVGAVVWWWIIWHFITEPGHIFGEFPYPDPSKWTDSELGIPSDDE